MVTLNIILPATLLLSLTVSAADPAKWTDKEGNVQYGDTPPPGTPAIVIDHSTMSTVDSRASNKNLNEFSQTIDSRRELMHRDQQRLEQLEHRKLKRLQQCDNLKENLRTLLLKVPVFTKNNDGTRRYLSDEHRVKKIADARSTLKKHCP